MSKIIRNSVQYISIGTSIEVLRLISKTLFISTFAVVSLLFTLSSEIFIIKTLAQNDYAPINYATSQNAPYLTNDSFQQQKESQSQINIGDNSNNNQTNLLQSCCPCDEAKYELIFEGLWSKYTHPDDFPESELLAYFGDIIGASHSNEFRMWEPGALATDGVKELAESGSTKRLESELKLASLRTRTIIKARELHYPTLNSKTSAVFRTDRRHHLVSILSKLGPSPDWMVGVSALDLCQPDCTWSTQRTVNLFPWDAGIDSGNNFSKSNLQTTPQEPIHAFRRLNNNNNIQSSQGQLVGPSAASSSGPMMNMYMDQQQQSQPASSSTGRDLANFSMDQMKPFARLTITRQRIYEKSCNHSDQPLPTGSSSSFYNSGRPMSEYGQTNSQEQSQQQQNLWQAMNSRTSTTSPSISDCRYTNWSDWTSCSSTCGKGIRTRTRSFKNDRFGQTNGCSNSGLVEKEICLAECRANSTCYTRDWGSWSRCSVDCGQGRRKRTRSIIGPRTIACESIDLAEEEPCIGMGDCSGGQTSSKHYSNSQPSPVDGSEQTCDVTPWSAWTECSRHPCGGTRIRTRQYLNRESVGVCKIQLIQKRQCPINAELCRHTFAEAAVVCNLAPDEGPCYGHFARWYYDNSTRSCATFAFRGCAGNENNFDTLQDCEYSCVKPMKKLKSLQNHAK